MLFTSPEFIILLMLTFFIYYLPLFKRYQVIILIISSFIFYSYYVPALLLLLIFSILINAICSYFIHYKNSHKKMFATVGVIINLAVLCFFKYSPLVARSFFRNEDTIGQFLISLPLPIGISFFTFEGITLLVDTFKSNTAENKKVIQIHKKPFTHLSNVAFFISFFPHLISGPILKAYEFFPQIASKKIKDIQWEYAIKLLITGCFLKMVIADNLKEQTFGMAYPAFLNMPSSTLIIQIFGYSMQIFSDFAGYSLIALGLASLFGYKLNQNFNYPYISTSFSEFWKRWHISLSSFLKEYLYFPLGGNKYGKIRTYFNLLTVMFLGGLWHGAAWSYAVWGLFHGAALAFERLIKDFIVIRFNFLLNVLAGLFVFVFVSFAWLLFKLTDFNNVVGYFNAIQNNVDISTSDYFLRINTFNIIYSIPVFLYHFYYLYKQNYPSSIIIKYEYLIYATMLFLIITNSGLPGDFIYFQF